MYITLFWVVLLLQCNLCLSNLARSMAVGPSQLSTVPNLILISGCTGTGKSTFGQPIPPIPPIPPKPSPPFSLTIAPALSTHATGMSLALNQRILKCISTDTVRQVMRTMVDEDKMPALHRSSYQGAGDAVTEWRDSSAVLEKGIEGLVEDSINRGVSLVLEGVHIVPGNDLIDMWKERGGNALGIVLCIENAEAHKKMIMNRGLVTATSTAERQLDKFARIRDIHDEMVRFGSEPYIPYMPYIPYIHHIHHIPYIHHIPIDEHNPIYLIGSTRRGSSLAEDRD